MKQRSRLAVFSALSLVAAIYFASSLRARGPRLKLTGLPSVELSDVTVGVVAEHRFVLTNVGTEPLRFAVPRPFCGCTSAIVSPAEIAPGHVGEILVRVDTRQWQALGGATRTEKVSIASNDVRMPDLRLEVKLRANAEFVQSATSLQFGALPVDHNSQDNASVKEMVITEMSTARVVSVLASDPSWKVELRRDASDARQVTVRVSPPRDNGTTQRTANIIIKTTSELMPELRLFVLSTGRTTAPN